jgi:DNA-directed RNA polymerase specialized sigma24 family protein
VVDLHFYKGLTQAQTARLLGLHEKEVSRRWLRAARQLPAWAPGS